MGWTFSVSLGSSSMLQFIQDDVALVSYISNGLLGLCLIVNTTPWTLHFPKCIQGGLKPLKVCIHMFQSDLCKLLCKNWYGSVGIKKEFITWIIRISISIILDFKTIPSHYVIWIELSAIKYRTRVKWNSTPLRTFKSSTWVLILKLLKINQNILEYNYVAILYPESSNANIASFLSTEID